MKHLAIMIFILAFSSAAMAQMSTVTIDGRTTYIYTSCIMYSCNTTIVTPEEASRRREDQRREAIQKMECKRVKEVYGKNLEMYPLEFRDYQQFSCIQDAKLRHWIADTIYQKYSSGGDNVVTVVEYHDHLREVGYRSKIMEGKP